MSWRALFERSELVRPPKTGVRPLHEARRGVNGFAHFCRNKSGSSAGAKPGNTKYYACSNPPGRTQIQNSGLSSLPTMRGYPRIHSFVPAIPANRATPHYA
jgi:hypothetical protein